MFAIKPVADVDCDHCSALAVVDAVRHLREEGLTVEAVARLDNAIADCDRLTTSEGDTRHEGVVAALWVEEREWMGGVGD